MKIPIAILSFILLLAQPFQNALCQTGTKHFIFFSLDRENIHDSGFYSNPGISGAQVTYPWKRLEPQKDQYDFSEIEEDMNFLNSKGKKLFIQLQDVTFDSTRYPVPKYILTDSAYHGGADPQYYFYDDDEDKAEKAGWVSRRWDPAVADRFHKLLIALGQKFNGKIEGINLAETAIAFGENGKLFPKGFTYENYRDAIKENMKVLKQAFPNSTAIMYANFMYEHGEAKSNLKDLYNYAKEIRMGMGGPDIKVYRKYQMENSYPLIRDLHVIAPTGVAVQHGNYDVINPKTGKQVTVPEILNFAEN
ncbi:MAG: hypothetical protein ABIO56_18255 [Ferruginibacter sp.]